MFQRPTQPVPAALQPQPKPLGGGDVQVDATTLGAVLSSTISRRYLSML